MAAIANLPKNSPQDNDETNSRKLTRWQKTNGRLPSHARKSELIVTRKNRKTLSRFLIRHEIASPHFD
jgi:hypothetical protein